MAGRAVIIAAGILLLSITARAQHADPATLEQLLERAGTYVVDFEARFSNVVTEERYIQESTDAKNNLPSSRTAPLTTGGTQPNIRRRDLKSDFLLVKLPETDDWLPFRDVFEVDKHPVRDREDRLSKMFLRPTGSTLEQARRIMEESARYNIGNIQRTINLPVFALDLLGPPD